MAHRSVRVPDDLDEAVVAEAERRGRPWSFSSVFVEWAELGQVAPDQSSVVIGSARAPASPRASEKGWSRPGSSVAKPIPKKGKP